MSNAMSYIPERGSAAELTLAIFAQDPKLRVTLGTLGTRLATAPAKLQAALTSPLTLGLLEYSRHGEETVKHMGAGPKLQAWVEATMKRPSSGAPVAQRTAQPPSYVPPPAEPQAAAAAPAASAGATPPTAPASDAAPARRGRPMKDGGHDNLASVQIRSGVPIPPKSSNRNTYAALWQDMKVGDMVTLKHHQAYNLQKHVLTKQAGACTVRRLDEVTSGVWRTA